MGKLHEVMDHFKALPNAKKALVVVAVAVALGALGEILKAIF